MKVTIMESVALRKSLIVILSLALLISVAGIRSTPFSTAFSPHQNDFFKYNETSDLGNGTGNYAGYTEHQTATGGENVTGVSGNTVSMNYGYSYDWSNSSGATLTGKSGGPYTFSDSSFLYIRGTDNVTSFGGAKYVNPTVWFAMNSLLLVGANFTILNTPMKIMSSITTVFLPTEKVMVNAIFAQGSGTYQRNDVYGQFTASYTWSAWYDPATGYIIGYNYVEQDTNPNGDGFTYADKLYVTASSYQLSIASPTTITIVSPTTSLTTSSSISLITSSATLSTTILSSTTSTTEAPAQSKTPLLDYAIIIVAVVVAVVVLALLRRRDTSSTQTADLGTHT